MEHDKEIQFISVIKQYPNVYDRNHPLFKNLTKREQTWEKIADTMKIPSLACQRIWRTLRDKYTKKKRTIATIDTSPYEADDWFSRAMSFMDAYITPRKGRYKFALSADYKPTQSPTTSGTEEAGIVWMFSEEESAEVAEEQTVEVKSGVETAMVASSSDTHVNILLDPLDGSMVHAKEEAKETKSCTNCIKQRSQDDSDTAFGAYVSAMIKEFNKQQKNMAKMKIIQVLQQIDLQN